MPEPRIINFKNPRISLEMQNFNLSDIRGTYIRTALKMREIDIIWGGLHINYELMKKLRESGNLKIACFRYLPRNNEIISFFDSDKLNNLSTLSLTPIKSSGNTLSEIRSKGAPTPFHTLFDEFVIDIGISIHRSFRIKNMITLYAQIEPVNQTNPWI